MVGTRVIAGSAKGRQLKAPRGLHLRPTAAKVREAIFSMLKSRIPDARVLDLYCGIGSLGIEALSRGAAYCVFVDNSRRAIGMVRANLSTTALADNARCVRRTLPRQIDGSLGGPFDLVFSDPPYADDPVVELAVALRSVPNLLTEDAIWVHEGPSRRASKNEPYQLDRWFEMDLRRYGDTAIWTFRV